MKTDHCFTILPAQHGQLAQLCLQRGTNQMQEDRQRQKDSMQRIQ